VFVDYTEVYKTPDQLNYMYRYSLTKMIYAKSKLRTHLSFE